MKLSFMLPLLVGVVLLAPHIASAQATPRLTSVEPSTGKAGDILNVTGENLEKSVMTELYLTDGKNDIKVEITEQSAKAVKFKIPGDAKPGRYALMVLTAGNDSKLIEQPVKVTVE
jgi:IPT/TIG domain.